MAENMDQQTATLARRRYHRFDVNSSVRLRRTDGSGREHEGICKTVAVGGMGVETEVELAVGEVIEADFMDNESMPCRARIVYRNKKEYGLQFLDIL